LIGWKHVMSSTETPESIGPDLQSCQSGEVLTDDTSLRAYSTASGIFSLRPVAVVKPRVDDDISAVVAWCSDRGISVTARGGGSGVAGQAINTGVIVDLSEHFTRVLGVDADSAVARVQAGVVLDQLRMELLGTGLEFGPDPQSSDRCTIGGMIATNAAGPRTVRHGATIEHVQEVTVVGSDGSITRACPFTRDDIDSNTFWNRTRLNVLQFLEGHLQTIRDHAPQIKNSSGYLLGALVEDLPTVPFQRVFCGAEGTLGIVTSAVVSLVPEPSFESLLVLGISDRGELGALVRSLRTSISPSAIEYLDRSVLQLLEEGGKTVPGVLQGRDAALLILVDGNQKDELVGRLDQGAAIGTDFGCSTYSTADPTEKMELLRLRKQTSDVIARRNSGRRNLRLIEDAGVPIDQLGTFVTGLDAFLGGVDYVAFGHAGDGNIHVNVFLDTDRPEELARAERLRTEYPAWVRTLGGTPTAEHGDGLLRTPSLPDTWPELYPLFTKFKDIFDPAGTFNPGKIVKTDSFSLENNLRTEW
jgi:FAD/FMN-containing dehydrogenase